MLKNVNNDEELKLIITRRKQYQTINLSFAIVTTILFSFLLASSLIAQHIPIGTWRTHLSYNDLQTLAIAEDQIYAGADNGFFVYDKASNSSTLLSTQDGFTSTEINQLAFHEPNQTLVIAYRDGNIDLLKENTISNIDDLAKSAVITDKTINHIYFSGNLAYLSANVGVVVLDMEKEEIRETYRNLGSNGTSVAVYASTIVNNIIYLATSQGVLTAPASGVNLLDFNNWRTFGPAQGIPAAPVRALVHFNNTVYAAIENEGIYVLTADSWQKLNLPALSQINNLQQSGNYILISLPERIIRLDAGNNFQEITHPLIQNPRAASYDNEGILWIADAVNGLVNNQSGSFQSVVPNGPATNNAWQLLSYEENILAIPGGFTNNFTPLNRTGSFSIFTPSGWENYTTTEAPPRQIPLIQDLVSATYNPLNKQLYLGSFGDGLLILQPDGSVELLNASNSPLRPSTENDIKITGLATDLNGNVWMTSYGVAAGQPSLYVKRTDNTWQSYTNAIARFPLSVLIDDTDVKWIPLAAPQGGIWVFDEKTNRSKYLSTTLGQGGLPSNLVSALAKDKEGQIWVGTERGVAVFFNPFAVFENTAFDAITPIFDRRALLRDEVITSIAVDGGNRKWIGTRNGLWLFNPDGSELIYHFTSQNSPLLSNMVMDVEIQPLTGEVFIATDKGIVSYRGTATEGTETHTTVKVFPNPVRPDFEGMVGISGLVNNAIVKITDVTGRLVYETRAQGSTAVWNVRDYTGRRAATGIYLIFSSNEEGTETLVSKMAVIE